MMNKKGKKKRNTAIILMVLIILCLAAAGYISLSSMRSSRSKEADRQGSAAAELIGQGAAAISTEVADTYDEKIAEYIIADHVYSHRGSAGHDEHSFDAYDAAIEAGSHNIEQDVVVSKDGTLYVSHDLSAAAMTGTDRLYSDMSDEEIDALTTYAGDHVLKLSEVLEKYGRSVHYLIELKSSDDATIEAFKKEVDEHEVSGLVIVQALENDVLEKVEDLYPDMPKLQVVKTEGGLAEALESDVVDMVGARVQFVNEENCNAAHEKGKKFVGWTLDSEGEIRNAIDVGADAYFTNNTPLALKLERKYRPVKTKAKAEAKDYSSIIFASDYQEMGSFDAPRDNLSALFAAAAADGKNPDMAVICGDYTNDALLHNYDLSPEDSIAEIKDVVQGEFPQMTEEDMIFVQGNHDSLTESIAASGLHEYDSYLVYVLNTEEDFPWKQGKVAGCHDKVKKASAEMKDCFDKLIAAGETRPIFIAGHVPLHFTGRTSSRHTTGDNLYSSLIFDVVNEAAKSLDIIYMYGHNHSKGWDCYMGGACVYRGEGDKIILPVFDDDDVVTDKFEEKTLNFTYMNAGYTGYYINCAPSDDRSKYKAADETLSCTLCEIYPDRIEISRYDADGKHVLGAAGEANPYKGGIDEGLIGSEYYATETEGPAVIQRKNAGEQMKDAA